MADSGDSRIHPFIGELFVERMSRSNSLPFIAPRSTPRGLTRHYQFLIFSKWRLLIGYRSLHITTPIYGSSRKRREIRFFVPEEGVELAHALASRQASGAGASE